MTRLLSLLCLFVIVLFTGCTEDLAGPSETSSSMGEPPALDLCGYADGCELVVAIKGGTDGVTGRTTTYTYDALARVTSTGHAVGVASLVDQGDPSRRFHYEFTEGETGCSADGKAFGRARGFGFITPEDGSVGEDVGLLLRGIGKEEIERWNPQAFTHTFEFTLEEPLPAPEREGDGFGSTILMAALIEGAPEDLVGVRFQIEATHAFFSPEICGTR